MGGTFSGGSTDDLAFGGSFVNDFNNGNNHTHVLADITDFNITDSSIKDLADVLSTMTPADGQVLTYDPTDGWRAENPALAGGFQSESFTLTDGQTVVPFTINVGIAHFYLNGEDVDEGRLLITDDYTIDLGTNTFTLTQSYPAGTKVTAIYYSDVDFIEVGLVGTSASETQTLSTGQTLVTFTNAIATASFYLRGPGTDNGRLIEGLDYSRDIFNKQITLTETYPAGTQVVSVYKLDEELVGNGLTVQSVSVEKQTTVGGETSFTLANIRYAMGTNSLWVYRDGTKLRFGEDFLETSETSISLNASLVPAADEEWEFISFAGVAAGGSSAASIRRTTFSGDDATTVFTLPWTVTSGGSNTFIIIGGLTQEAGSYTVAGTTLTFTEAPPTGTDNIEVIFIEAAAIGTTDASLVTYTPSGTGAVETSVQSKLRETVSVKDFGAVGDGVADDSAAIQAALDSGAKTVLIPAGAYLIGTDSALTVPAGVTVEGEGRLSIISKTSGTADIFSVTTDNVTIRRLRLNGPNNTGCDGIVLDGADSCNVEDIYGYQLASTLTAGLTSGTVCDDLYIRRVDSFSNTAQGINLNYASNVDIADCESDTIGTSTLHHGFYIGKCFNVQAYNLRAFRAYGCGIHVFSQSSFAAYNISLNNCFTVDNGLTGSGTARAGVLVGAESGSSVSRVLINGLLCHDENARGIRIQENATEVDVYNFHINGNSATIQGIDLESTLTGNRSIRINSGRINDCTSTGIRVNYTAGTLLECIVDDIHIDNCATGISVVGASVAGEEFKLGSSVRITNSATPLTTASSGTIGAEYTPRAALAYVATVASDVSFNRLTAEVYAIDGGAANRNVNPVGAGGFPKGFLVTLANTGATNNLVFDSTGIAVAVTPGTTGRFLYNGTAWVDIT